MNKVYYGEYSLEKWIELILSKEIVLPPYQRYFVWSEEQLNSFVSSLCKDSFVTPVIIGSFDGLCPYNWCKF